MEDKEIYESFDAHVWAKAFVERVTKNPSISTDEGTMLAWFSSALMRGHDEHYWHSKGYKRSVRRILVPWWKRPFVSLQRFGH